MAFQAELAAALAVIALLVWCYRSSKKNHKYYEKMPGPPGLPLIGNALSLRDPTKMFDNLFEFIEENGRVFKLKIGPFRKLVVVADYKLTEFILSSSKILNKSMEYKLFMRPWLGTGLLTSDAPKWRKRRKMLTPSFHFQILEDFIDVFESAGQVFVKKLETEVGKASTDVYPYVTLCALDIICETAMGVSVNAQNKEDSSYVRSVKEMCRIIPRRSTSPIEMYDLLYPLTPDYYKEKKALKILHGYTNSVIAKRRIEISKNKPVAEEDDVGIKRRKAFIDILLDCKIDGQPLSDEDIREEVDTFMFEGHDTTASGISFALYCLANNPEAQKSAVEEQKLIFNTLQPTKVTMADLQNMKYLELVIKETLRLYPSVPIFLRTTSESVQNVDGAIIPPDVTLAIFPLGIHRNPKYFPEPLKFKPERWNTIDGSSPYSYVPFSAGPRNCIGQKFAMLEMKSTISKVMRKFELVPAFPEHVLELTSETILKSTNGIKIGLKHRM